MDPREVGTIRVLIVDAIRSIDRIVDVINRSVMLGQDPSTDEWDDALCTCATCRVLLEKVGETIPYF